MWIPTKPDQSAARGTQTTTCCIKWTETSGKKPAPQDQDHQWGPKNIKHGENTPECSHSLTDAQTKNELTSNITLSPAKTTKIPNARLREDVTDKVKLSVYYQNVRGMNSRSVEVRLFAPVIEEDCIAITETWLNSERLSGEFFPHDNFSVYRCDRRDMSKSKGGGVLIAVKTHIKSTAIDLDHLNNTFVTIDTVGVMLNLKSGHITII